MGILSAILFSSADVLFVCLYLLHCTMVYFSFSSTEEGIQAERSWENFSDLSPDIYKVCIHLIISVAKWY